MIDLLAKDYVIHRYKRVRRWLVEWWTRKPEKEREVLLDKAQYCLNCTTTALLLSFPTSGLLFLFFGFWSLQSQFTVSFCILVSIPVMEHYYVWFRKDWYDQ